MADKAELERARQTRKRHNLYFGVITAIAALVMAFIIIPGGVSVPRSVTHLPLSPSFFPYVLTGLIFVFALIYLAMTIFGPPPLPDDADEHQQAHPHWKFRIVVLGILLSGYALLPEILGMLPTAIAVTCVLLVLTGERRPVILITIGALAPLIVYVFFSEVAYVPMPGGVLMDWD